MEERVVSNDEAPGSKPGFSIHSMMTHYDILSVSAGIRTRIVGFRVQSDSHYTTETNNDRLIGIE